MITHKTTSLQVAIAALILAFSQPIYSQVLQSDTTEVEIPGELAMPVIPGNRARPIETNKGIKPYSVELAFNKTTSIIFRSPIRSVDLGSRDIISEKYVGVDNVLRIKAEKMGFNETNFNVITDDGKLHSFIATYNEYPEFVSYDLTGEVLDRYQSALNLDDEGLVEFADVHTTQSEIIANCSKILKKGKNGSRRGTSKYKMESEIRSIHVKDNVMYVKVRIENKSNINYDLDYIRFFVKDLKLAKRTSRQEVEIQPIYVFNELLKQVKGKEEIEKIYVFQKFTIPNDKAVEIVMGEKNGGRTLSYNLRNDDIMLAGSL